MHSRPLQELGFTGAGRDQGPVVLQGGQRHAGQRDVFLVDRVGDVQEAVPAHALRIVVARPLVAAGMAQCRQRFASAQQEGAIEAAPVRRQGDGQRDALASRVGRIDQVGAAVGQVAGALLGARIGHAGQRRRAPGRAAVAALGGELAEARSLVAEHHHGALRAVIAAAQEQAWLQLAAYPALVRQVVHGPARPARHTERIVGMERRHDHPGPGMECGDDATVGQGMRILFDDAFDRRAIGAHHPLRRGPVDPVVAEAAFSPAAVSGLEAGRPDVGERNQRPAIGPPAAAGMHASARAGLR
jgi:hypothetical protein